MKRYRIFAVVLSAVFLMSCQHSAQQGAGEKGATSKPRIALVMKSLANEFFKTMEDGAKAHQQKHAGEYELIANGIKDETDIAAQNALVEQMIANKVDVIVIAPADSKALISVCQKAIAAGIVVINIDNKFDATILAEKNLKIPFVGPDNRKGAKLVGDYLAQQLKPGDPVAIVEGIPTAFNAQQRKAGFEDAIKAANLQLVDSQSGKWEQESANKIVAAMVTSHADLKAILCANDNMALGAIAALRTAGKSEQIKVIGFDNISAAQQLLQEGKLVATVDQHAAQLATFGIEYALEVLQKKSSPADKETPVELITKK